MDITKKGGHVVWMLDSRDVKKSKIPMEQARSKANHFLVQHGLKDMVNNVAEVYDNIAVLSYVYSHDNARVYPDMATIKVALDNGQIVGYQAEHYIFNHKADRSFGKPKLTEAQARKKVNPQFNVKETRKAVIFNDLHQEVLCYEFLGSVENQTFRVFINANNGKEESVEKLDGIRTGK